MFIVNESASRIVNPRLQTCRSATDCFYCGFPSLPNTHTCENTSCCDVYSAIICSLSVSSFPLFQESEGLSPGIWNTERYLVCLCVDVLCDCDEEFNIDIGTIKSVSRTANARTVSFGSN